MVGGILKVDGLPINSQTGNTSNGSTTITGLANALLLDVGQTITGNGIPVGSTVASIVSANAITISNAANANANGVTLTFGITFHTLKVIGDSGTNTFTTDGSIANVVLQGGSGTNTLTAGGGTADLVGGSGPNYFTLNGPGSDTVVGGTSVMQSADTAAGSSTITGLMNATQLQVGEPVSGPGIPSGTTIASIVSANSLTLSSNATATATGVSLVFGSLIPGSGNATFTTGSSTVTFDKGSVDPLRPANTFPSIRTATGTRSRAAALAPASAGLTTPYSGTGVTGPQEDATQ